MLTTVLLIFTIVVFSPTLISALGKRNAAILLLNAAPAISDNVEGKELHDWVVSERRILSSLAPAPAPTPYEYVKAMLKYKPASATISSFIYTRTSGTLAVKGIVPDRTTLLAFQSALAGSGEFAKVDFPVNNLAKEKDIDFQFTLTLNP